MVVPLSVSTISPETGTSGNNAVTLIDSAIKFTGDRPNSNSTVTFNDACSSRDASCQLTSIPVTESADLETTLPQVPSTRIFRKKSPRKESGKQSSQNTEKERPQEDEFNLRNINKAGRTVDSSMNDNSSLESSNENTSHTSNAVITRNASTTSTAKSTVKPRTLKRNTSSDDVGFSL